MSQSLFPVDLINIGIDKKSAGVNYLPPKFQGFFDNSRRHIRAVLFFSKCNRFPQAINVTIGLIYTFLSAGNENETIIMNESTAQS